jgi:acetylglutamate kinase
MACGHDARSDGSGPPGRYRANRSIVTALRNKACAQGIQHGVFACDFLDQQALGLVGSIQRVDLEAIRDTVCRGVLPVVSCLGESATGQVMNINADVAARELIWAVKPHKIIFLTTTGGLLDESGRVISAISLCTDYEHLVHQPWVHSGMRLKLEQIGILRVYQMLLQFQSSVENLAGSCSPIAAAGTLIRKGEPIEVLRSIRKPG